MFLDPEPKQGKQRLLGSPFFAAQMPTERAGDQRWRVKRKPLQERSASQLNQGAPQSDQPALQSPESLLEKPTVRLVRRSPSPSAHRSSSDSDSELLDDIQLGKRLTVQSYDRASGRLSDLAVVQKASAAEQGLGPSSKDPSVSDSPSSTNEAQKLELPPTITLLPKTSTHVVPKTAWHRRSGSSGNYSNSSTLQEGGSSFVTNSRRSRISEGTTLRGTPTPCEQEHSECIGEDEDTRQGPAHALETLQETSPERSTIRAVPPSVSSSNQDHLGSASESSLPRPQTAPSDPESEALPAIPRKNSRRRSSAGAPATPSSVTLSSSPAAPQTQTSEVSVLSSDFIFPEPSSPIIVIFDRESSRPRSRSRPLHYATSLESIQSRLQHPTIFRPDTGRSLTNSSSWASLRPTSSNDTLPPLQVPKRRVKHKPTSSSLGSRSAFASGSSMAEQDYDALPYPRHQFSSHLSTIASESDRQSRSNSQQLSHFSLGSGVLTGDDASSIPFSGTWPRRRRESAPVDSVASGSSPVASGSTPDEQGDMTLGIFREESAKPQPLFKPRSPSAPGEGRKYDGPLPPVPPIPKSRDSNENFDTVSELQSPSLRPKRSGYSLRQRSNSTPSGSNGHSRGISQISYLDSERGSQASSLFPTWAKHFYGGTTHLLSASKISLHAPKQQRPQHERNPSQWTERSMTSRLGTGYSEIDTGSPTSSRFLPSIFRPRTRAKMEARKSKRSRPSGEADSRPDSLAIFNDPMPGSGGKETLPSGQPKFGKLKDSPATSGPRPLPRKYSKQKHWNEMEYPRPMTKDRLSDFALEQPHLTPTHRQTNRLSGWRPPSFVESLDTLIHSRCNRQILLFVLGFLCPLLWMVAAALPLPQRPSGGEDLEKSVAGSEEDVQMTMMKHEAGDAERRWREEKQWMKARWWRTLNRVMSVIGVLVIGAVIALAVVATR